MKLILVAGARPNFMKIAPLMHALSGSPRIQTVLVHTGQHHDPEMSARFFADLQIPAPQYNLASGGGSPVQRMARIMERFEQVCWAERPGAVLVVGDVDSTPACAWVAVRLGIYLLHYEAGLRSGDRSMPEEINRVVTDALAHLHITTTAEASAQLLREGVPPAKIRFLGNLMVDALVWALPRIRAQAPPLAGDYGVVTFHRPANVDGAEALARLLRVLGALSARVPLFFPMHPRTRRRLKDFGLEDLAAAYPALHVGPPLGYLAFMGAVVHARFVLTDSGGIQEETTWLGLPCLTLRPHTERPETLRQGTNTLVSLDSVPGEVEAILCGRGKQGSRPPLWDGQTALRIRALLEELAADPEVP